MRSKKILKTMAMVCAIGVISLGAIAINPNDVYAETIKIKNKDTLRVWGNDRFETANKIADEFCKADDELPLIGGTWNFPNTKENKVDTVILANAFNYPDAMCGTPLSKIYNAPMLLTNDSFLTPATEQQIKKMGVKKVVIVGGEGVVKPVVEEALKKIGVESIERFGGKDRYETSYLIAEKIDEVEPINDIFFLGKDNWVNALTSAPTAARYGVPILLVPSTTDSEILPKYKEFLERTNEVKRERNNGDKDIYLGTAVYGSRDEISQEVLNTFGECCDLGVGGTLQTPSVNVNNMIINNDIVGSGFRGDPKNVMITRADVFADSLSVGPLAAKLGAPIVIYGKSEKFNTMEEDVASADGVASAWSPTGKGLINRYMISTGTNKAENVYFVGGETIVPTKSVDKINCEW